MAILQTALQQWEITQPHLGTWTDTLLSPVYVALVLLVLQTIFELVRSKLTRHTPSSLAGHGRVRQALAFLKGARQHEGTRDRTTVMLNLLRLIGTSTLVGLSATAFLVCEDNGHAKPNAVKTWFRKNLSNTPEKLIFSHDEYIEIIYVVLYTYTSLLASITLFSRSRWRSVAGAHLTTVMLTVVGVYVYRDIYPLATFTLLPKDAEQGWLLWSRIGIGSFIAVLIPLLIPREYHPIDPLHPSQEVNTEQTASLLSFLTFTFLDPMIWLAARTSHLEYESLPPLADYDAATHLMSQSEKILDPFLSRKKTHLFWGLMHYFAWEYIQLAIMLVLKTFAGFLSPLGIYWLLAYLQRNGENAFVRPWFWVLCLYLGPIIGSIVMQYYIFLNTRNLVRVEGIVTQLVFDHALRIRMKEETEQRSIPTTVFNTPENGSVAEEVSESPASEEDTLHGGGSLSTVSSIQKMNKRGRAKESGLSNTISSPPDGYENRTQPKASNLVGRINNFVTTDLGNITEGRDFVMLVVQCPLVIALCIAFLYEILSWSALIGMLVMVLTLPLPGYIGKLINNVQTERMDKTDARVQTVTEVLSVIRMTKLFGWEQKMEKQISKKREIELQLLKKRQILSLLNSNLNFFCPLLTMLVTFASYTVIQGKDLNASILFSSIAIFDMLRDILHASLYLLPMAINAKVSLGRINDFLHNTELLDRFTPKDAALETDVNISQNINSSLIGFRNATFIWSGLNENNDDISAGRQFRLVVEGDLFFRPQKLNLVIGPTGSGKTSLLMALLGEMHYEPSGEAAGFNLPRSGGVAYAAQETWVQSETIRENILFGKPYEKQRYDKVIYQCGLERDLGLFDAGDATEVGEKGLTLSGGQKARITLARAVYSDAKILLLDDILAALDVHTARFIVDKCLQGDLLQGRTTILVTHNVSMVMPISDFVVSLGLDGRIASQDDASNAFIKNQKLPRDIARMEEAPEDAETSKGAVQTDENETTAAKLVVPEEIQLGHVGWSALKLYFSALGGSFFWLAVIVGMLLSELALSGATWFLGYWSSQYDDQPSWAVPVAFYLSVYALILLFVMAIYSVAWALFVLGSVKASRTIHKKLIQSVLGTTLRWLDTVPTARIIARCTQDIRAVDGPINQSLGDVIGLTILLAVKFCAAMIFVPIFVLPGLVVFIVGGICGQLYIKAQLSIKREMSNRRSPVLAHFGAAISGLTSIRAYNAQGMFRAESLKRINEYTRPARAFYNCNRWICIRIDAISGAFAAGIAAVLVYGKTLRYASNAGFSLTMAVGFSSMILWWVRILNEFEVQGNSLERIENYVNIEQEPRANESNKPPAYWPASGSLKVEKLSARYSVDGPQILHDISFEIKSGERVGVVGRTGSGKSSLTLSLLRCIPTEGRVTLDGLRTDSINLDALRSKITIIPQQPELLSGALRDNLDPFAEHSDTTLNDALRAAGLFTLQEQDDSTKITLDSPVSSGGGNLSVGQRQILALARAIVRQSKLLILDEATSAIDYATDAIIQNTLREVLKDATLITVAHRLQTIMDADRIMVLDAGRMVEFDSPANLLKKNEGYFRALVDGSGDRQALWEMVGQSGKARDRMATVGHRRHSLGTHAFNISG